MLVLKWLRCFWKSFSVNTLTFFLMKLHLTYPHKCLQNHLILLSWHSVKLPLDAIPTEELQFAFCDCSLFYWPWLSCYYLHLFVISSLLAHIYIGSVQELDYSFHFVLLQHVLGHGLLHSEHFQQWQNNNAPALHGREKVSKRYMNIGASGNIC